jgi:hypothetical protein
MIMSYKYVVLYLFAVGLGYSQAQLTAAQDAGKLGSISGTVREAGTGSPMPEADIFVGAGPSRPENLHADGQGRYTIRDLKTGDYRVWAMAHVSGPPGPRPTASRPVSLGAGQELTSIDIRLAAPGKISGKVVDDNGEPVSGVSVFLVAREYSLGALRYVFAARADTDDRGVYVLSALSGRAYLLYAWKINRRLKPVSDAPADAKLRKRVTAPTFYPSSDSIEGASPITLRSGESRDRVDIQVLRAPAYCVDGEVPSVAGGDLLFMIGPVQPTSGTSGDGGFFGMPPSGTAGPDHKLRICDLSPGDYQLTLIDSNHQNAGPPPYFGSTTFTIKDQDVHGIAVNPRVPVKVPGEVVWDGTAPAEPVQSRLRFWLRPLTRAPWMGEKTDAESAIPGEFVFPALLVDAYQVRLFGTPRELYIKEMTYGRVSILQAPLLVGSGVGEAHLHVVLGRDGGFVKAKVADKDGNPVADCYVILMPADAVSEAALAAEIIVGQTDQSGAYSSNALAPGKYFALVSSRAIDKSPEDVSSLLQDRSHAQEIIIGAGATVSVTLGGHASLASCRTTRAFLYGMANCSSTMTSSEINTIHNASVRFSFRHSVISTRKTCALQQTRDCVIFRNTSSSDADSTTR